MNTDLIIVKAKFALYSTDIGGRKTPIISGYRPNHVFEYKENSNDFIATYIGDVNFEGQEFLYPGELIVATVRFLRHGDIERFIQIGRIWWIHEGRNKIGEAEIIEI
jgi:translation elongation factor EF-Tu-like GTPase